MFKQFIEKVEGSEIYLVSSLGIFLVFFILVAVMLFLMKKEHIDHMSKLPLSNEND